MAAGQCDLRSVSSARHHTLPPKQCADYQVEVGG
jgi:hypothetical protein